MSEIGSIKRVDDAGRIVIPADIRKAFCMNNGDMVHITVSDGKIVVKEFEKTKLKKTLTIFLKCFYKVYHASLIITNENADILTSFGSTAIHKIKLSKELIGILQENTLYIRLKEDQAIYASEENTVIIDAVYPIYHLKNPIGALILLENRGLCNDIQLKGLEMLANIIAEYISEGRNL